MAVFRIEKTRDYTVMSNHHLKDKSLTLKSKGLLSMILSLPDDWNYSTRGLAAICKEGVDSIGSALKELEKSGYIVRNQLRDKRGRITDTEYIIYEKPQLASLPSKDSPDVPPHTGFPYMDNPDLDEPDLDYPAQYNTKESNKKILSKYPSILSGVNGKATLSCSKGKPNLMDRMEEINAYRDLIMQNIEYDILVQRNEAERVDEVVELMLDMVCSRRETISFGGDDYPREVVKSRFLKIDSSHVEYVFMCIDQNTTKVRNIRKYLLAALYNAPTTIDSFYRTEVNHKLYSPRS